LRSILVCEQAAASKPTKRREHHDDDQHPDAFHPASDLRGFTAADLDALAPIET
jgi:hypothetical protein